MRSKAKDRVVHIEFHTKAGMRRFQRSVMKAEKGDGKFTLRGQMQSKIKTQSRGKRAR